VRAGLLYVAAAGALVLIVSVAWWTRESLAKQGMVYTTQPGDTVVSVAQELSVPAAELAAANDVPLSATPLPPGTVLDVPAPAPSSSMVWFTHLVGLGGEVLGVFMSLWLALVAGLLPKPIRRQVLGISLVVGTVSYASTYAVASAEVLLTPTFLFLAIKDGFAWAAAFPMLARALGIRDAPPPAASPPPPEDAPEPTAA
jgi:LysM repeat protein